MTSLLDAVTEDPAHARVNLPTEERSRLASVLVAACLNGRAHLEELDTYGPNGRSRRFLTPATGPLFRRMFDEWLVQSDALVSRVRPLHGSGHPIARFDELKDAIESTRGLLRLTMERIENGLDQIRQGQFLTPEEARRELHATRGR